jgi:hypothetical protein
MMCWAGDIGRINYECGVSELYALIAPQAVKRLGLRVRFGHFDSTGFHVDGDYNNETGAEEGGIHLTRGDSRDHRSDLSQVVLQLIVDRQVGLPLLMQPLDGNAEDKSHFRQTLQAYLGQLRLTYELESSAADSALYTAETLPLLQETGVPGGMALWPAVVYWPDPARCPSAHLRQQWPGGVGIYQYSRGFFRSDFAPGQYRGA